MRDLLLVVLVVLLLVLLLSWSGVVERGRMEGGCQMWFEQGHVAAAAAAPGQNAC